MKTWFITGSSRGLGLEIARAALEAGDQVVATARAPKRIEEALTGYGDKLLPLALDVTDIAQAEAAVAAAKQRFGRIDVLVNNAGFAQLGAFEEISHAEIEQQFATNVFGTFHVTRAVLPVMREQRAGHVITISSSVGILGYEGSSIYCSGKFALEGWSESLVQELAPLGIKVTLVEPGMFCTDFLDAASARHGSIVIEDLAESSAKRRAMLASFNHQQPGDPKKLAAAMLKLASAHEPPARLPIGSDSVGVFLTKADMLRAQAEQWHDVSTSTDRVA